MPHIAVEWRNKCICHRIPRILGQDMGRRMHQRFRKQEGVSRSASGLDRLTGLTHFRVVTVNLVRLIHNPGSAITRSYIRQEHKEIQIREMVHSLMTLVFVHTPLWSAAAMPAFLVAHVLLVSLDLFRVMTKISRSLDESPGILECGCNAADFSISFQDAGNFDELDKRVISKNEGIY